MSTLVPSDTPLLVCLAAGAPSLRAPRGRGPRLPGAKVGRAGRGRHQAVPRHREGLPGPLGEAKYTTMFISTTNASRKYVLPPSHQESRVDSGIAKLRKARSGGQQMRMDAFFGAAPAAASSSLSGQKRKVGIVVGQGGPSRDKKSSLCSV